MSCADIVMSASIDRDLIPGVDYLEVRHNNDVRVAILQRDSWTFASVLSRRFPHEVVILLLSNSGGPSSFLT